MISQRSPHMPAHEHDKRILIDRWHRLAEIARKEPSIPVWRPRTKYARALWTRVDARWRALLADARSVPSEKEGPARCD